MLLALQSDYIMELSGIMIAYGNEFFVFSVFTILSKDGKEGFLAVKCFANFVQSFHKTYSYES